MKRKWKIALVVVALVVVAVIIMGAVSYSKRGIVTVQTGKVVRTDLESVVTASGEIKPRNYINIGTNALSPAPITAILVKEGDHVRRGQVLARLANVQPAADVSAQDAALNSALADATASEAAVKSADDNIAVAQAQVAHDEADLEQKKIDFKRAQDLFNSKLIASQDFEAKKATLDLADTTLEASRRKVTQSQSAKAQAIAQFASVEKKIAQNKAMVMRSRDVLSQYSATAPLDGVVTNLPVRVGETVVPGIQNSASSTLMTIADMSIITAEVDVDEADIVSVRLDQPAEVTVDAIPNRTFKGRVIEIGDTAIVRSTGLAASQVQTSSQEAKDFKVKIALDIPENLVRPGLSCTAKVTTAVRKNVLAIPIQALAVREKGQLSAVKPGQQPQQLDPATEKANKEELQGVWVVANGKVQFRKVETGITGATQVEVVNGLEQGNQIVTGSYQVIRTIKNDTRVKIDNKPPKQASDQANG